MAQQIDAADVATPIAQIDRRTLSQAWYSALHVVQRQSTLATGEPPAATAPIRPRPAVAVAGDRRTRMPARFDRAARQSSARQVLEHPDAQRRAPRSPFPRALERETGNPPVRSVRTTLTLGPAGARVFVVLQSCGERVRLIAICRPQDREHVERTLAQARIALAACGRTLHVQVGAAACC